MFWKPHTKAQHAALGLWFWESVPCFLHGALLWPALSSSVVDGWGAVKNRVREAQRCAAAQREDLDLDGWRRP